MLRQRNRLVLILLGLSAVLHFYRLSEPRRVVFDEVHFGGFVNSYHAGDLFFDIHPPHAKLLIAGAAIAGGYRGGQSFQQLGAPIEETSPALFRLVPAIAGTLLPLVLFAFARQLGASPMAAFAVGLAVLFDNALLVQTRLIALDGTLLVAAFGSLSCFLAAFGCEDRLRRTGYSLLAGLLAGLAAGVKFTGLAALALIGACLALDFLARPSWRKLRVGASHSVWILSGALVVYAAGWAVHFALLDKPGPDYHWPVPTGEFLADVIEIHRTMHSANTGLRVPHPDASPWWAWPLMAKPLFYWSEGNASLYFVGNPVVWWGTSLGALLVAGNLVLLRITNLQLRGVDRIAPPRLWIPTLGYLIAFAPLIPVQRPLFLYHYLSPLLFALCGVALWLDHAGWTRPGGFREQRLSFHIALGALVAGFAAMSPFVFSFLELPEYRNWVIEWLPIWP